MTVGAQGSGPRSFGLLRVMVGLTAAFLRVPGWWLSSPNSRSRTAERAFFARILRAIDVDVVAKGRPSLTSGTLFVANHVSWTDIAALSSVLDAVFVARSDLRRWPLLGPLAERVGTIFVERHRRSGVRDQSRDIAARLAAGDHVRLFAQGTTTDGSAPVAFRPALLQAAAAASRVQPVALAYSDGTRRAWIGNETLPANLIRLASYGSVLTIHFLPAEAFRPHEDRKALALRLQRSVNDSLAAGPATPRGHGHA